MSDHRVGTLPATRDRHGARKRGDAQLVYEAGTVLNGAIRNAGRRWMAGGGLHIDDATYRWAVENLDQDRDLTDRVLLQAGFHKTSGKWKIGRGAWPLARAVDLGMIGNLLAGIVDTHRPL